MRPRRTRTRQPKSPRAVRWEIEAIPWTMGVGMLFGFLSEVIWQGNVLWMIGGGLAGGLAGAICDTALFLYRRIRRQRTMDKAPHS